MRRATYVAVVLAVVLPLICAGCGGGGGGSSTGNQPPVATASVKIAIMWPERNRGLITTSAALSAKITIRNGSVAGEDVTWVVNRPGTPDMQTVEYPAPEPIAVDEIGEKVLDVLFYADAGACGDVVAEAHEVFYIQPGGSYVYPEGGVCVSNKISSIEVVSGQSLNVGEEKDLAFVAKGESGNVLAISPGSITWSVVSGSDVVQFVGGKAKGITTGQADVVAAVYDVNSAPVSIEVKQTSATDYSGRIIFQRGFVPDYGGIYEHNLVTGATTQLVSERMLDHPSATVDGGIILYSATDSDGKWRIYWYSSEGDNAPLVGISCTYPTKPTISPDGTWFSYRATGTNIYTHYVLSPIDRSYDRTLDIDHSVVATAFSFDSRLVAYSTYGRNLYGGIKMCNTSGGGYRTVLTSYPLSVNSLAVSPDGMKIVYEADGDIYVASVDGADNRNLTNSSSVERYPVFSPDGRNIAFVSDKNGKDDIYVMAVYGSNHVQITNTGGCKYLSWVH